MNKNPKKNINKIILTNTPQKTINEKQNQQKKKHLLHQNID